MLGGFRASDTPAVWREGPILVMRKSAALPGGCVRCGQPEASRLHQRFYWHSPWLYALIISPILYVILALILRKSAEANVPLCDFHRSRRRLLVTIGAVASSLGFVAMGAAIYWDRGDLAAGAGLAALAGLVLLAVRSRVLQPKRIDDNFAWLRGADHAYLAPLPDWRGYDLFVGGERLEGSLGVAGTESSGAGSLATDPSAGLTLAPATSPLATAAAVCGGLSLFLCPAPVALILGIVALLDLRSHPERRGRGQAWFGTIMGGVFSALLVLAVALPSSSSKPSPAPSPVPSFTIALSSAEARLSVPSQWKARPDLNKKADLGACDPQEQSCVILLTDRRADFRVMSLDSHSESTRRSLTRSLQDLQVSAPRRFLVAGHPALQYEIRGAHNNLNLVYLHTTIETGACYHQIVAWTLATRFDSERVVLDDIVTSFRELLASPSPRPRVRVPAQGQVS